MEKKIFTFWEPKENIPAYLKVCMKTWEKYLPEYEIIILDYENLYTYLDKEEYFDYLFKNFSLPKQADAIRCFLLNKYGGIWLDTDTVLTSDNIKNLLNSDSDMTILGRHIGFIKAKQNSRIISQWKKYIIKKILLHRKSNNLWTYIFNYKYKRKFKAWDYLGNSIVDKLTKNKDKTEYCMIEPFEAKALPENNYKIENGLKADNLVQEYIDFYFTNDYAEYALKDNKGVIYLHNSWTPKAFKQMTEEEFLNSGCTLANILKKVL